MNRENWAIWEGPEVEGRLHGVPTLFIGDRPANELQLPERLIDQNSHSHVYFLHEFISLYGYGLVQHALSRGLTVTVGLTPALLASAPAWVLSDCHIQLVIAVPALVGVDFKPTDSVRLDIGPYHVVTATHHSFLETQPVDYSGDRLIAKK